MSASRNVIPFPAGERVFQFLVQNVTGYAIYMLDLQGRVTTWNVGAERIKGYSAEEIIGKHFSCFYPAEQRESGEPMHALAVAFRDEKYSKEDCKRIRKDGSVFRASVVIELIRDWNGTPIGFAKITRDITARKNAEEEVSAISSRIEGLFRSASIGLAQVDQSGQFLLVNQAFCQIAARSRDELLSSSLSAITHVDDLPASRHVVQTLLAGGQGQVIEKRYVRPDGSFVDCRTSVSILLNETGSPASPVRITAVIEDVSEQKRAECRIRYLALHDDLTGLPNRSCFGERLKTAINRRDAGSGPFAVLSIDLDGFKAVNDTFGHAAGDAVLTQVADRLRNELRPTDSVARVGGDEFLVLESSPVEPSGTAMLADRLIEVLCKPFHIERNVVTIGASVGIAVASSDVSTELLANADAALYVAKASGGRTFRIFEHRMAAELSSRQSLELDLRAALDKNEFSLAFQPLFACRSGLISGFEALLRWHHPGRGDISPTIFIPIAERIGLIQSLGLWALETACSAASRWSAPLRIAVNISSAQFYERFPTEVELILRRTGLSPNRLELELTETLLFENTDVVSTILSRLTTLGVRLVMDDFGTGYSSLNYLRNFQFDCIKIDRSFMCDLQNPTSLELLRHLIALAKLFKTDVIGEGIETFEQLSIYIREHCDGVQGILLGRPMSVSQAADLIGSGEQHVVSSMIHKACMACH